MPFTPSPRDFCMRSFSGAVLIEHRDHEVDLHIDGENVTVPALLHGMGPGKHYIRAGVEHFADAVSGVIYYYFGTPHGFKILNGQRLENLVLAGA